jgi:hypothetical protein
MTFFQSLLEKLACKHSWEQYHTINLWLVSLEGDKDWYGGRQTLICKKCGKIRKIKL